MATHNKKNTQSIAEKEPKNKMDSSKDGQNHRFKRIAKEFGISTKEAKNVFQCVVI